MYEDVRTSSDQFFSNKLTQVLSGWADYAHHISKLVLINIFEIPVALFLTDLVKKITMSFTLNYINGQLI